MIVIVFLLVRFFLIHRKETDKLQLLLSNNFHLPPGKSNLLDSHIVQVFQKGLMILFQ
jgi:hypothetical protein